MTEPTVYQYCVPANHQLVARGDGLWGIKTGAQIDTTEIELIIYDFKEGDPLYGSLSLEHQLPVPDDGGLCYTDKGILETLQQLMKKHHPELFNIISHLGWSEQGRQSYLCADFDITLKPPVTGDELVALGMKRVS